MDPESYPEELWGVVEAPRQGREHLERPSDPAEVGIAKFNQFVAGAGRHVALPNGCVLAARAMGQG